MLGVILQLLALPSKLKMLTLTSLPAIVNLNPLDVVLLCVIVIVSFEAIGM